MTVRPLARPLLSALSALSVLSLPTVALAQTNPPPEPPPAEPPNTLAPLVVTAEPAATPEAREDRCPARPCPPPPRVDRCDEDPAPSARSTMIPAMTAGQYARRSTSMFATVNLGFGPQPGVYPHFTAGIALAGTVRSTFSGFVLDLGMDVLFEALALSGSSSTFLQFRPSARVGYTGAVSDRVALGLRGGYSPSLAFSRSNAPGFIHQVDMDLFVTYVTARGVFIESYLGGGALIANPVYPVIALGARVGVIL